MAVDVPGYGRFDPSMPAWLKLGIYDGKLYNVNAAANRAADGSFQAVQSWVVPAGFVGGTGYTYTPEAALPQPVEPPPAPVEPPAPPPPDPALVAFLAYQRAVLEAALDAAGAQVDAALAAYEADTKSIAKVSDALAAYEAALAAGR